MSKKTFWSESFRDSLNTVKETIFMKSKESFQNQKEEMDEKLILEEEMTKRLKEEFNKKQKRMEMENYKHIELMQNIEEDEKEDVKIEDVKIEGIGNEGIEKDKKNTINIGSIQKMVN